jgi:uncharacterized membrane protein YdjX (TVP38/TMEM64 family)
MLRYLAIFILITFVNIVPVFMPATWTILTFLAVVYDMHFVVLSIVGAVAATLGRLILARGSRSFIRQNFLSERTKKNIDYLKSYLEQRQHITFILFLSYAFTPLPTNQLFIAYGLTDMKLRYLAIPFFIGRIASYLFLTFATNKVADIFPEQWSTGIGSYFIIVQLLSIGVVYLFTKIDWRALLAKKEVHIIHNK